MSFLTGVDDFLGGVLNSNAAQGILDIYKQKEAADLAAKQLKAQAELEAQRLRTAQAAAKAAGTASPTSGGGISPNMILIGVAGALGLGVVIWAATRK